MTDMSFSPHPIVGQEAVCPDGLGRVVAFEDNFPNQWIQIDTYLNNRSCKWAPANVRLLDSWAKDSLNALDRGPLLAMGLEFIRGCRDLRTLVVTNTIEDLRCMWEAIKTFDPEARFVMVTAAASYEFPGVEQYSVHWLPEVVANQDNKYILVTKACALSGWRVPPHVKDLALCCTALLTDTSKAQLLGRFHRAPEGYSLEAVFAMTKPQVRNEAQSEMYRKLYGGPPKRKWSFDYKQCLRDLVCIHVAYWTPWVIPAGNLDVTRAEPVWLAVLGVVSLVAVVSSIKKQSRKVSYA